jgi:spore photoproduct lyase
VALHAAHFSRIYVEPRVADFPLGRRVLEKFSKADIVEIGHYKDVFNRPRQDWDVQRASRNIILAVREDKFIYDGSPYASPFGHKRFFYNTLVLNCLYDCGYCYLQGMFPSSHVVVFVNQQDFKDCVTQKSQEGPLYLCISYDTDLLAFEGLFGLCSEWYHYVAEHSNVTVELRTKSSNKQIFRKLSPIPNFVLAWTLSPQSIICQYEKDAPSLRARLESVKMALEEGWKVRLCIDPILYVDDWEDLYQELVDEIARSVDVSLVYQFSLGVFRMNSGYLKKIRRRGRQSAVLYDDFVVDNGASSYGAEVSHRLVERVRESLTYLVESNRIVVW